MKTQELEQIEVELSIVLPSDYRNLLHNYPENLMESDAPDFSLMFDHNRIIEENLNARKNFWGKPLNKEVLIIGENGCGDYFLIETKNNSPVYSFFHDNNKFYRIADGLEKYIEMILDDTIEENWGNIEFESQDFRVQKESEPTAINPQPTASGKKKWWQF